MSIATKKWDWETSSKTQYWSHTVEELWSYRHLLAGLVKRHFLIHYQQTVLGPVWIIFQPLMTLVTYMLVFNKMVGISTGSLPPVLFYSAGIVLWNFLHDSFIGTSNTFRENSSIFSKVYFPRIIMPLSVVITQFLRFLMQFVVFLLLVTFYALFKGLPFQPGLWILAAPLCILMVGAISLGTGVAFSLVTAKYRDVTNLVALGVRLLMFVTPVIYPLEAVSEKVRWIVLINPLTPVFELFRLSLLGSGTVSPGQVIYSLVFTVVILVGSVMLFNKQGDKLIDVL